MEEVSKMYHEAIATYKRLLMETAFKTAPPAVNTQTVSDPSGGNYGNQPVASGNQYSQPVATGNQYLSSYVPPSVFGQQQPEMSSMNPRYSPELSRRAQYPAAASGGLLQQQQQPLPQAPPTQSVNSIQLAPPAYQVSHTVQRNKYMIHLHQFVSLGPNTRVQSPRNWKVSVETLHHHTVCRFIVAF